MFQLTPEPIDDNTLKDTLRNDACGAFVCFEGWVRNTNEGRTVHALDYEGYEAVAVKEGNRVIEEARKKFGLGQVVCVHRVGRLALGDLAVWVGVSAGHRGEAFEACRYVIDEIKERLPIWKKEYYTDGDSGWVNCETGRPRASTAAD